MNYSYNKEFMFNIRDSMTNYILPDKTISLLKSLYIHKDSPQHLRKFQKRTRIKLKRVDNSKIIKIINKLDAQNFNLCRDEFIKELTTNEANSSKFKFLLDTILKEGILLELFCQLLSDLLNVTPFINVFYTKTFENILENVYITPTTYLISSLYKSQKLSIKYLNDVKLILLKTNNIHGLYHFLDFLELSDFKMINVDAFINYINTFQPQNTVFIKTIKYLLKYGCFNIHYILDNITLSITTGTLLDDLDIDYILYYIKLIKINLYTDINVIITINNLLKSKIKCTHIDSILLNELLDAKYTKLPTKWKFKFMDLKEITHITLSL